MQVAPPRPARRHRSPACHIIYLADHRPGCCELPPPPPSSCPNARSSSATPCHESIPHRGIFLSVCTDAKCTRHAYAFSAFIPPSLPHFASLPCPLTTSILLSLSIFECLTLSPSHPFMCVYKYTIKNDLKHIKNTF